jgi:hypothetical protein
MCRAPIRLELFPSRPLRELVDQVVTCPDRKDQIEKDVQYLKRHSGCIRLGAHCTSKLCLRPASVKKPETREQPQQQLPPQVQPREPQVAENGPVQADDAPPVNVLEALDPVRPQPVHDVPQPVNRVANLQNEFEHNIVENQPLVQNPAQVQQAQPPNGPVQEAIDRETNFARWILTTQNRAFTFLPFNDEPLGHSRLAIIQRYLNERNREWQGQQQTPVAVLRQEELLPQNNHFPRQAPPIQPRNHIVRQVPQIGQAAEGEHRDLTNVRIRRAVISPVQRVVVGPMRATSTLPARRRNQENSSRNNHIERIEVDRPRQNRQELNVFDRLYNARKVLVRQRSSSTEQRVTPLCPRRAHARMETF